MANAKVTKAHFGKKEEKRNNLVNFVKKLNSQAIKGTLAQFNMSRRWYGMVSTLVKGFLKHLYKTRGASLKTFCT